MDKIYFLHDALIISQISVWEMVLFSQLLYLMFCNGPNQFSYFLICNIVEARISWKSGFFFLPISLFGYFCFTHYTENSFFMQETHNHLHELQLKETNQYFCKSRGITKRKGVIFFWYIFYRVLMSIWILFWMMQKKYISKPRKGDLLVWTLFLKYV